MKGSGRGPERNNERWRVEELYQSPLTLKLEPRAAFLDTHCGDDPLLRGNYSGPEVRIEEVDLVPLKLGSIVRGVFTPVLAKHTKSLA